MVGCLRAKRELNQVEVNVLLAAEFEAQHGRAPDARALGALRQWANHASRRGKGHEPLDLAAEARRWAAQARACEAGALEPVMAGVTSRRGAASPVPAEPRPIWELTPDQQGDLMAQALARVQELSRPGGRRISSVIWENSCPMTWPAGTTPRRRHFWSTSRTGCWPAARATQVLALEAPEWPRVPESLRRADGRSIYRPHSGMRYAAYEQLTDGGTAGGPGQAARRAAPRA